MAVPRAVPRSEELVMNRLFVTFIVTFLGFVVGVPAQSVAAQSAAVSDSPANRAERRDTRAPLFTQVAKLLADDGSENDVFGFSVAVDGTTAVIGAPYVGVSGVGAAGAAYVFVRTGSGWSQQQKLVASDPLALAEFGLSVAIDGETIAVGAPHAGTALAPGAVYVFVRSGGSWTEQVKLSVGPSVSVSGDTLVAGSRTCEEPGCGPSSSAWVFVRSGTTWSLQQELTGSSYFGQAVSVDGDTTLIDGGDYCPVVFSRTGGTWTEEQTLSSVDCPETAYFAGRALAVEGDLAVVGAHQEDIETVEDAGSAYVFERSGTTWSQQQQLTAAIAVEDQWFGQSVAIEGDRTLVATRDSAYVFVRSETTWVEDQELLVGPANSQEASRVSLSGDIAVVGAPEDSELGAGAGAAFVFERLDADLEIDIGDFPDPVHISSILSYTLSVTNHGPDAVGAVTVIDTLDPETSFSLATGTGWSCAESAGVVTCTRPGLDVESAPDITIQVQSPGTQGTVTNTATVDAGATDPTLSNNTATEQTVVTTAGYTPTEARLGGGVVINEILVDPEGTTYSYDTDGSGTLTQGDEFVELFNLSDVAVDISGWHLADYSTSWGDWFTFPGLPGSGTTVLGPGHFAVVVVDVQAGGSLPLVTGGDLAFDAGWSEVLDDDGDNVVLWDPMTYEGVHLIYDGDPALSPPIVRIGPVEDWGSSLDGVSLTRDPPGDVGVVLHHTVSSEYASPGRHYVVDYDFGDAPDPTYPTLLANGGASHLIVPGIYIGGTVDADPDGQPTATADGDDLDGNDDEEIPVGLISFTAGSKLQAPITVAGAGFGNAWIDANQDGDWDDPGEHLVVNHALSEGTNIVSFAMPSNALPGSTFLRLRFSSQAGLGPGGPAPDGEVEDYPAQVVASADLSITKDNGETQILEGSTTTYTITVSSAGPSDVFGAQVSDAFPAELSSCSWTCGSSGGGTCTASGVGDLMDTVSLPVGTSVQYSATCTVAASSGTCANTANVIAPAGVTDSNGSNDSATDTDPVLPLSVFADGFEDGDTSAWSSTVPPPLRRQPHLGPEDRFEATMQLASRLIPADQDVVVLLAGGFDGQDRLLFSLDLRTHPTLAVRARASADDHSWQETPWVELTRPEDLIGLEWTRSEPGRSNGRLELFVDGFPSVFLDGLAYDERSLVSLGWAVDRQRRPLILGVSGDG